MSGGRIIVNSEVRNFRDYGGWQTVSGKQVTTGRLLRSGHWADAKGEAHALLQNLGIEVFVDLRRAAEREQQPNLLPDKMNINELVVDGGDMQDPPHIRFLRQGNLTKDSVRNYMFSAYRRIPIEEHHQQLFRQAILNLGQGKTVLIHCAAGKDRTGILAALILGLLGVNEEDIIEDYLLTNQAVDIKKILPSIAKQVSERLGKFVEPEVLFPMLGVEADFLQQSKNILSDPEHYARNSLDLKPDEINRLRESLIVEQ